MQLFEMQQFLCTADHGSISEAAKELFVSQPTLSHNIKKLESEFGCQLFDRTHSGVKLTPFGQIVYDHTKHFFIEYESMLEELNHLKQQEASVLHLGCFAYGAASFLVPSISAALSDMEIVVTCCSNEDLLSGLRGSEFDAIIADERFASKDISCQSLYTEKAYISVPHQNKIATFEKVTSDDLVSHKYVIEDDEGFGGWYRYILSEAGVPPANIKVIPFKQYLQEKDLMSEFNLVTSFIMDYVRISKIRSVIPIDEPYASRNIGLLILKDAPSKAKNFSNAVKKMAPFILSGNANASFSLFNNDGGSFTISTR